MRKNLLIPDRIYDSVRAIPSVFFEEEGIRLIIFDIDNTLVPYDVPVPDKDLRELLLSFEKRGIKVSFVSNNSPERVEGFNESLGFFTVPDAHKPLKKSLSPIFLHFRDIKREETVLIGDQLLTDVLAARLNGVKAVAVKPIKDKENLFFRFKRMLEKPFIRSFYKRLEKENGGKK